VLSHKIEAGKDTKMRGEISEIIKELLRTGSKKPKELREQTKKKVLELGGSFSDPNYYYHLKKLQKIEEVKKIDIQQYELIEEKEVDPEVRVCASTIRISDDREKVYRSIQRLRILTEKKKRIAHQPDVLHAFEECLGNSKIVANPEIFQELTLALGSILRLEREIKNQESDKIIERITDEILGKVINIVKRKSEFPEEYTIEFLAECNKEESVTILFWLTQKFKHQISINQVETVGRALKKLYPKHHRIINQGIGTLNQSGDEKLSEFAKKISDIVAWAESMR